MRKKWKIFAFMMCMCICFCLSFRQAEAAETGDAEIRAEEDGGSVDFSYMEDFSELGVRVCVRATDHAIPSNASVQIIPVEESDQEILEEMIQWKIDESLSGKIDAAVEGRSIFGRYADLYAEAEKSYVFQILISYVDEDGIKHTVTPEGNDAVQVSFEMLDSGTMDEMHAMESFSLTEDLPVPYSDGAVPSTYSFVVVRYAARADDQRVAAQQKAWEIINEYADPNHFLTSVYKEGSTQYEELHNAALEATAGCTTDYEKIKAIVGFVADRTYYDYYYYDQGGPSPTTDPYGVYTGKKTVCAGYAKLVKTLLVSIGIPCMSLYGNNHEYNAAYDSQQDKWIFADATWCSGNGYYTSRGEEVWSYGGNDYDCFDLPPEKIARLGHHEVYGVGGLLYNAVYYSLKTPHDNWEQMDWKMEISGMQNAKADGFTAVGELAGIPVKTVKYAAFSNCSSLTGELKLPDSLEEIGFNAFYNCSGLTGELKLPDSLEKIGARAFYNCSGLTGELKLPAGLKELGEYAFYNCNGFTGELRIPSSVITIGDYAFYMSESNMDKNIVLTAGTTSFGYNVFKRVDCNTGDITIYAPEGSYAEKYANDNGHTFAKPFAQNDGYTFYKKGSYDVTCRDSDVRPVINEFKCDGTYTYYFQLDGTAMRDRLTYHPDGEHIIYFDADGHEVFSEFANIRKSIAGDDVDDMCFFNVFGYMYVDTLTYDKSGTKLYYVNPYGVLERKGWFAFSGKEFDAGLGFSGRAGGYGYANPDCSLLVNTVAYDWEDREVYLQGDGHMFKD